MRHRRSVLIGSAGAALLASGIIASVPSTAADNTPVNPQVTDAVTQTNVKVVAQAPAQSMASLYVTQAQSVQIMNQVNASPQAVMNAITVQQAQVAQLLNTLRAGAKDSSMSDLEKRLDAIHRRLRECGPTCIMNIQVHGLGPDTSDRRNGMDVVTDWILLEEAERLRSDEVATISYVGDGDAVRTNYRSPLMTPTRIDFLVQDVGADVKARIQAMN